MQILPLILESFIVSCLVNGYVRNNNGQKEGQGIATVNQSNDAATLSMIPSGREILG